MADYFRLLTGETAEEYPTAGDPGKTMVSLKRIDARTIQETDAREGKVTDVIVSKVSADGKTMTSSTTTIFTAPN